MVNRKNAIAAICASLSTIVGIAAAMLTLLAATSTAAEAPSPNAVYPVRTYDFGTVKQGQKVSHCFVVRNEGKGPLRTAGMQLPTPEIVARAPSSVAPGQEGKVCVDLDTSSMSRAVHTWVIIFSNDPTVPKFPLYLNGVVNAPIDLLPYSTVFASLFKGESAQRGVIVMNNQKTPLKILGLETQGQHFKASIKTRKPGQIYEVAIDIPATVPPGRYKEFVYLKTDSRERPSLPITINLLIKDDIYAFPNDIDFGQVSKARLGANPDDTGLLTASFLVKKREGQFRIESINCDVKGLQLTQTPRGDSDTFRFDITLPANKLEPGRLSGNITLHTDDKKIAQIVVPIRAEVQ
jgi:hypothetical protein